ncbi:MAG: GNAT family N-acetyltransferase [Proteobacteria bacterium]|nr:GNAT family N-acetyltransferase [Pseudomonadota bacterium]MBU1455622.1 GNAT family N-acetyltransferase [Pseudomonadota bacterium]
MNSDLSGPPPCRILPSLPGDVDRGFHDLSRDMDPSLVHVFLDKLQRYAAKPDRALFFAESAGKIIGFATIIDRAEAPEGMGEDVAHLLQNYGCGTGLMVLPEFRRRGVARILVQHWQQWAQASGRQGVWIVTREMADWYQRCFHYSVLGTTVRHGVKKTVLARSISQFSSS